MDRNRREFVGLAGTLAAAAATAGAAKAAPEANPTRRYDPQAWHQRMKRIVHVNFNERDPEHFDAQAWAGYLGQCKAQATYLSGTNVVAFYPTRLPDLPVSAWLNGRDIFGECVAAAKKAGVRVMARFSIDIAKSLLAERHPEWFCRNADGSLVRRSLVGAPNDPSASSEFAPTCQFTSYYTDFVPKIFQEVLDRYPVDGIYTNGWPGVDAVVCYCDACRKIGDPHSDAYREAYQKRAVELWNAYASLCARHDPKLVFSGNLGGGFRGGNLDLTELTANAPWFMADNQGRGRVGEPAWDSSQQTRIGRAIIGDRPVTNITAGYEIAGDIRWRNVTGNPAEVRSRLFQTLAAGGTIHYHWLGFYQGFIEDRRWQQVGRDVLSWQAANDRHFHNARSIANVALVVSQRSNRLYQAPAGTNALDPVQGMYQLLTEARIPFDVILESNLTPEALARYKVLVLANVALMSDAQAGAVRTFVAGGGSLLSTFETGLYDQDGKPRPDFALGGLYGMRKTGARESYGVAVAPGHGAFPGSSSMQRIERSHPLVDSFKDTHFIQGSSCRMPIAADGPPILTDIAQYPWYPTEGVYSRHWHTDQPTIVVREQDRSRLVYLAGDIEAGYWRSGAADLGDLVTNALRWLVAGTQPLIVEGEGLVEAYAWETEPGYAVHLVNHSQPGFRATAARKMVPAGPQKVRLTLPDARPVRGARLLWAGQTLPFTQMGSVVEFVIPDLDEYEVAAFEV
jgi:hypothetical protein